MFVYVIVNSETLKIYIGQHKGNSLCQYLQKKLSDARHYVSQRSLLYRSMRKHSRSAWSIHPLISDLSTREECDYWERLLIKALNTQHADVGYNIAAGGQGNTRVDVTEETRKKQSLAAKLRFADPQEREKHSAAHKGKPMPPRTEEHKRHLSEANTGHKPSAEQLLHQSAAQKGKPKPPRTEEHKRNNAAALRGIKRSPEQIAKNRASHLGVPWSAARRAAYEAKHPAK
jgi:hypothetical protein